VPEQRKVTLAIAASGIAQDLMGIQEASWKRRAVRRAELVTLLLFQLVLHALMAASIIRHPEAFSNKVCLAP
jgi:hypothetical protein